MKVNIPISILLFGGLDYKLLMTGEDPLSILMPVLSSTNVHVIAKLANKVPCKVAVSLKIVLLWNNYLIYAYCIWWLGIATYIEYISRLGAFSPYTQSTVLKCTSSTDVNVLSIGK